MDFTNYMTYVYISIPLWLVLLWVMFKPKKPKGVVVNEELINNIFDAIKKGNIKNVESEISRVKIDVSDLDLIDLDLLKEISEGVFISGKSLKIMFKDSADSVVEGLKGRM